VVFLLDTLPLLVYGVSFSFIDVQFPSSAVEIKLNNTKENKARPSKSWELKIDVYWSRNETYSGFQSFRDA
jgi:hypothetical protein